MRSLFIVCVGIPLCVTLVGGFGGSADIQCYGRHEVKKCVNECPPERTCKNRNVKFSCFNGNKKCEDKCICEDGYYRNQLGDCISKENCERCPGDHEYYTCGRICDNVCSELHIQNKTNCPIVNIVCNEKCYCEDGFARDGLNKCIPIAKCSHRGTRSTQCGPNQEYVVCPEGTCRPQTCEQVGLSVACPSFSSCDPGCACSDGYVRHENGTCIPYSACSAFKRNVLN